MGYDVFWSFVIFAILAGSVMLFGVSKRPSDGEKSSEEKERR